MEDMLLEPGIAYQKQYKDAFHKNCEELFTSLVRQSGLNEDENRKTAAAYRAKDAKAKKAASTLSAKKGWRTALIVLTVLFAAVAIIAGVNLPGTVPLILLLSGILLGVGCLLLIFLVLNPKIKNLAALQEKLQKEADEIYGKAMAQMRPLLSLFDSAMTAELIHKTVPTLIIDKTFDMRRYDVLHGKYGLSECGENDTSAVHLISGEINGNPFIVEQDLIREMLTETYTGSLTIHWTEYETDSEGRRVARHRSETLTASVEAPKPFYHTSTRLVYGNDAAPDLSFSRDPGHAEKLSQKELERKVEKGAKAIRKKAERNVSAGFTEVGNDEFDVLFGALNRDHEVQFRLLFTPLAQKNILSILTGKASPYGDDFRFVKKKCLNMIRSEHGQKWDFDINTGMYRSYDVDICRKLFYDENEDDFKQLYYDLAPLLAIPLYQQQKPREYIYGTSYPRNCTAREAEVLANAFPDSVFTPAGCSTRCILKTSLASKNGNKDLVNVTAYGYHAEPRVTHVSKFGGDGKLHSVPVHWTEYLPVEDTSSIVMQPLDKTDPEYLASPVSGGVFLHRILATRQKK